MSIATISEVVAALRVGSPVIVVDDEGRENEGDAVMAAQFATQEWIAGMVRHTSGYLCAPMPNDRADALHLPLMVPDSEDPRRTAYTVSVDAAGRYSTGISAPERAHTLRVLADPTATAARLIRPGHILPPTAPPRGGVLLTRPPQPPDSPAPDISCRCGPWTEVCASAPVTPRPPLTSCDWRAWSRLPSLVNSWPTRAKCCGCPPSSSSANGRMYRSQRCTTSSPGSSTLTPHRCFRRARMLTPARRASAPALKASPHPPPLRHTQPPSSQNHPRCGLRSKRPCQPPTAPSECGHTVISAGAQITSRSLRVTRAHSS